MSQMQWTYVDDYLRKYRVGLYHGDRSGHLMIHCNAKVVVIDFHVKDSRKYTFYINDELMDVHIERQKNRYAYSLEIDEHTKTPRNIRRLKRERIGQITAALCAVALHYLEGFLLWHKNSDSGFLASHFCLYISRYIGCCFCGSILARVCFQENTVVHFWPVIFLKK